MLGKLGRDTCIKMKVNHFLKTIYKKEIQNGLKNLHLRPETIKSEKNLGSKSLAPFGLRIIFLDMSPQARATKARINQWKYSHIRHFAQGRKPSINKEITY